MSEQLDLVKLIADQSASIVEYAKKKYPDRVYMFEFMNNYWKDVINARESGKPIVMCPPNFPMELIYALDAVPFVLEQVPTRLASGKETFKYIDLAEQYIPATVCAMDKIILGAALSGDYQFTPNAFLYCSLPCDNARAVYPLVAEHYKTPTFCVDTPYRRDKIGYDYIAANFKEAYEFLQKALGREHNEERMAQVIRNSNRSAQLLTECGKLRQLKPCPLPSRMTIMNGMVGSTMGAAYPIDFLEEQLAIGQKTAARHEGVTPGDEKYRILWLQNMIWSNASIMDWMETKYNAVSVMDDFGFQTDYVISNPYDMDEIYYVLGQRSLGYPMVHGACGPAEKYVEMTEACMETYGINLAIYAGHVGCKHTWASAKIISDLVKDKYNVPVLTFDLDSLDIRYKSTDEIKQIITEFMETLESGEKKA